MLLPCSCHAALRGASWLIVGAHRTGVHVFFGGEGAEIRSQVAPCVLDRGSQLALPVTSFEGGKASRRPHPAGARQNSQPVECFSPRPPPGSMGEAPGWSRGMLTPRGCIRQDALCGAHRYLVEVPWLAWPPGRGGICFAYADCLRGAYADRLRHRLRRMRQFGGGGGLLTLLLCSS